MKEQFGDRLRKLRIEKEMTQEDLAKKFNTGKASISHYESNRRIPDANTIKKYADYFGVTIDYILGITEERNIYETKPAEIPEDLKDLGMEYITLAKDIKRSELTPEEVRELLEFAKKMKKK
ncbi:MAG: helix-turn-helix transcriptional regulator [Clostridia bacterium]|nr:helix-turn-helix transcriptional regulator [Clostridia bacterium]